MRAVALLGGCALLMAGCVGMTQTQIRQVQPELRQTKATANAVLECVQVSLNDLPKITTYPSGGRTEVSIGLDQLGDYRVYYLIDLRAVEGGTALAVRRANSGIRQLSEKELDALLDRCAPRA